MTIEKRKLEDWELAECKALKDALSAFNSKVSRPEKITQEKAAGDLNITQGALSSFLNGRNALTLKVAVYFAKELKIPISQFSKRLADEASEIGNVSRNSYSDTKMKVLSYGSVSKNIPSSLEALLTKATPRSQIELEKIAEAAADGRLTEDDIKLLKAIADRLAKKD